MKGVLFTEFLELLEDTFGIITLDKIVEKARPELASDAIYTSVGAYPHSELLTLIGATVEITDGDLADMLISYAERLMASFEKSYPDFFSSHEDFFSFLTNVEGQMHAGVRKLYPDAQPPTLEVTRLGESEMSLIYRSHRPLSVVVEPLVLAAAKRFSTKISVESINQNDSGTHSEFHIQAL